MNASCSLRSPGRNMLPVGCSVKVNIVDVHASVFMSQKFRNPSASPESATYTFSMLAGAAICGFEMVRQDGTKVEGVVKEKEQAKKEYKEAINQGFTAALGEEQTKDVFSIFVGNILPFEIVTINLRFLQPLLDDEKHDQLRFMFPRAYAQRYGPAPTSAAATASTVEQPFKLEMTIQQAGAIKSVACPSGHALSVELGPPEGVTLSDTEASHFAKVSLRENSTFLIQDVLIVITAQDLDAPRCFVEPHPSQNHPTTAFGLTFVPRFKIPDFSGGMEYIFVVDRSGSMEGGSIKLVREALVVLLRGLPTKYTSFNIVSFGSRSSKLWSSSKPYTQASLDEATKHVDSLQADYGGTEIAMALSTVFDSLKTPLARPVSVFLLTDGGAWDIDNCVRHTEKAIKDLPGDKTFLRVFTVGIGNGVSTNTCDSIARAGNGTSVYVSQGEAMTGKCSRLIRAARTPPIVNLTVSWPGKEKAAEMEKEEDGFELVDAPEIQPSPQEARTVNLFQSEQDDGPPDVGPPPAPTVTLPPPPLIQQAPITLDNIFPGTRTQFYAIISNSCIPKSSSLPPSIKVQGTVLTTGDKVELSVPTSKLVVPKQKLRPGVTHTRPLLHTAAARAFLTDREGGKGCFSSALSKTLEERPELTSAYLEKDIVRLGVEYSLTSRHTSFIAVDRSQVLAAPRRMLPESWATDHSYKEEDEEESDEDMGFGLFDGDNSPPPPPAPAAQPRGRISSPAYKASPGRPQTLALVAKPSPLPTEAILTDPGQRLAAIARLQSFAGAFDLTETLLRLLGAAITDVAMVKNKFVSLGLDPGVGATILALSWLKLNALDEAVDMIEKAAEYVGDKLGGTKELEEQTRKVLESVPFAK